MIAAKRAIAPKRMREVKRLGILHPGRSDCRIGRISMMFLGIRMCCQSIVV